MSGLLQFRCLRSLLFLCIYAALAIATTWPLARQIGAAIPQGKENSATVALLNVWTIWWNGDRAWHLYDGYWDAPIFFPTEKAFAFSETQPLSVVVAPIQWVTGSRVAAYNTFLLLMLALNGWTAFHLLRRIEFGWLPAFAGGVLVQLLPFAHWQLGTLQLVPLFGIVWTVHAWYGFCNQPNWLRGTVVGLALAVTYHLCNYYGLFFSVLFLLAAGWLLGRRLGEWRTWLELLPGVALAALLIFPMALVQRQLAIQHGWERNELTVAALSAHIGDYTVAANSRLPLPDLAQPERRDRWLLGPGYVLWGLAAVGSVWGLMQRKRRQWTLFCLTLLAGSVALSLGPSFTVFGWSPYASLMQWYPGFAYVRSPFRFAVFAQLAVALLAAMSFESFAAQAARWKSQNWLPAITVLVLGIGAAASVWPHTPRLYVLPDIEQNRNWIVWLREKTPDESVLVCIPFASGRMAADFANTAMWMYWSTFHERSLAGGYTGHFPDQFFELQSAMKNFPDPDSIELLRERQIDYCVVRREEQPQDPLPGWPESLHHVFSDEASGIAIYRLQTTRTNGKQP